MLLKEEVCIVADVSLKDMTYRGECVDVWNDIWLLVGSGDMFIRISAHERSQNSGRNSSQIAVHF